MYCIPHFGMDSSILPSITFPTMNNSNTNNLSGVYNASWETFLNMFNQPHIQLQNTEPLLKETEERQVKVSKSSSVHTSPNHIESSQPVHIQGNIPQSGNSEDQSSCPICLTKLNRNSFEEHYRLELAKLDEIADAQPISPDSEQIPNRNKREAALFARKKVQKQMETQNTKNEVHNPLEVLKTIRQNRASRRKEKGSPVTFHTPSRKAKSPSQECFLCGEKLFGGLEDINEHIDACLSKEDGNKKPKKPTSKRKTRRESKESDEVQDENIETYTWGGVTRVRTCSLLENGYNGLFGVNNSKASVQEDEAELDIENDEISKFGASQYNEKDLIVQEEEEEDTKTIRERVTGANSDVKLKNEDNKGNNQEVKAERAATSNENSGSMLLLIEALKEKIREQESRLSNSIKCLICMESYKTPLVSVNCWHVHCEKCWLTSLGAMKLCPQCKVITSPSDLRKIFL